LQQLLREQRERELQQLLREKEWEKEWEKECLDPEERALV
jgi:hypothetical protein